VAVPIRDAVQPPVRVLIHGHGFQDLDGHIREVISMDASAMPAK